MFKWLKDTFTHGEVRFEFIALDENDEPYQDTATLQYKGAYDADEMQRKLRRFLWTIRGHMAVEITEVDRKEWQSLT